MTPEVLTEKLKAACGSHLKSVVLFGSAAAGDHTDKQSDYNVLVVLDRLGVEELKALAPATRAWVKRGNPAPLLFTQESLARSTDTFPLEIADIKESHRVLFGEDVPSTLPVNMATLRHELEHEFKGKLMQLRSRYLLSSGKPRQLTQLMIRSLSTFLVLFRGALRLYQAEVPAKKLDALAVLAKYIPIRTQAFETVAQLKSGNRLRSVVPEKLFAEYLQAIESVVNAVDVFLHATH